MGAWDIGPFDNDDAADWLYELEGSAGISALAEAINAVADIGDEYLEAPECAIALAAAEIVAALTGRPAAKMPDNVAAWIHVQRAFDASSLKPIARSVVQRIRDNSELKELWDESDDAPAWYATLDDVSVRLSAGG